MLTGISRFDSLLWLAVAGAQIITAVIISRSGIPARYPWFAAFIYFSAAKTPCLMAARSFDALYFWSYYSTSLATSLLLGPVLFEIYMYVFGPRKGLPPWAPRNVAGLMLSAIAISSFIAVAVRPTFYKQFAAVMVTANTALDVALWMSMLVLIIYSRRMRIGWLPWPQKIAVGFVLCLTINSAAVLALSFRLGTAADIVRQGGQLGYMAALMWWSVALWEKEPAPVAATDEQVSQMLAWHRKTMDVLNRAPSTQVLEPR